MASDYDTAPPIVETPAERDNKPGGLGKAEKFCVRTIFSFGQENVCARSISRPFGACGIESGNIRRPSQKATNPFSILG